MAYDVRRSVACRADLASIFDRRVAVRQGLGEDVERATRRLLAIEDASDALGAAPHQGTLWPEVMDGLRWVAKHRAALCFTLEDDAGRIDILTVFFGGEEYKRRILDKIRSG